MSFREDVFLKALTERPEEVKVMQQVFQPEWLENAEYQPVLQEIYRFSKEFGTPPTIRVLHENFENMDKELYEARFKNTLDKVDGAITEVADVLNTLSKAKDVAISRSFMDMVNSPIFAEMNEANDGKAQLKEIENWHRSFRVDSEDLDFDIKEAIEALVAERGYYAKNTSQIPCGLQFIDDWSGGGLRPKNLAILIAPTGHGKSVFLTIAAHNIAAQGDHNVLHITNELSMGETTERFMSRITGTSLNQILDDPSEGYHGMKRHWDSLEGKLRLLEINREIDSDEIEALVLRYGHIYGWRPDVVVIDFMERMKPTVSGVKRDQSWNWLGYIAKDLVRMAKRNNWLVWTAGQSNRRGFSTKEEQTMEHAQGSVQHLQEAALVVGMRQVDDFKLDDPDKVLLQFKPLKLRHSKKPGTSIMVEAKIGYMRITNTQRYASEWADDEAKDGDPGKFDDKDDKK